MPSTAGQLIAPRPGCRPPFSDWERRTTRRRRQPHGRRKLQPVPLVSAFPAVESIALKSRNREELTPENSAPRGQSPEGVWLLRRAIFSRSDNLPADRSEPFAQTSSSENGSPRLALRAGPLCARRGGVTMRQTGPVCPALRGCLAERGLIPAEESLGQRNLALGCSLLDVSDPGIHVSA